MQKNTPLETMYMEYAKTVKHFLISLYARRNPGTEAAPEPPTE